MPSTKEYTTITVPVSLKEKIATIADRKKVAMWRVINEAMSFYETIQRKPKEKARLSELDKCSWYVFKFVKSVSLFQENPTKQNWLYLQDRIEELASRIFGKKIPELDVLAKLCKRYMENPSRELKIEINETAKVIVSKIITKMLFCEEQ